MDNSLIVIMPYKFKGLWVFDDDRVNLLQEPFVFGVPEMIDEITQNIPNSDKGFRLLFSEKPFPHYQYCLKWLREEYEGNWYEFNDKEGWLCPALLKYFDKAPKNIYIKAEQS